MCCLWNMFNIPVFSGFVSPDVVYPKHVPNFSVNFPTLKFPTKKKKSVKSKLTSANTTLGVYGLEQTAPAFVGFQYFSERINKIRLAMIWRYIKSPIFLLWGIFFAFIRTDFTCQNITGVDDATLLLLKVMFNSTEGVWKFDLLYRRVCLKWLNSSTKLIIQTLRLVVCIPHSGFPQHTSRAFCAPKAMWTVDCIFRHYFSYTEELTQGYAVSLLC